MKLASYQDGSRDGVLIVVSRDLATAHFATGIATRLQQVLDDWNFLSPQLEELSVSLNHGRTRHSFAFDPKRCMAPLPRGGQWVSGGAYPTHAARLSKARGGEAATGAPAMVQGASDHFTGPHGDIEAPNEKMGIDFEAGLAAITGDIAPGESAERALDGVRLLMLANAVTLRHLADRETAAGLGWLQARPAAAFSPVAVTPDELGAAWKGGRVHLPVQCQWNGKRFGLAEAGSDMAFDFGQLLHHLAATRHVRAGAVVGTGAISNDDTSRGFTSIAEKRALELSEHGESRTDYLRFGDTVRIEVKGLDGQSVFGAIDQTVTPPGGAAPVPAADA